ncbi:MAG: aminotransferase class III-fold pyridoxal phosphate-dependent enzyme [Acidobacteria bacterium]|nr:aminotransferase class III-fold pyridoxal phosphate-dependent enzyme [Acidobacteriota bacterium]
MLTVSVGHANPDVNAAIIEQTKTLQHTSALYANQQQSDLAEKLAEITPGDLKKSFFTSSGTEADDTAIMAAKLATGRGEIVVLRHSYSGRSATPLSSVGLRRVAYPNTQVRRPYVHATCDNSQAAASAAGGNSEEQRI